MKKLHLGEYKTSYKSFEGLEEELKHLSEPSFQSLEHRKQFKRVNTLLLQLIQQEKTPCFLLPAVLEFIERINSTKILPEPYRFSSFEFWLNHFSGLDEEENLFVRGKIAGRYIPRDEYQTFFPIGMDKYFSGSHFVAAHASPDVDTTVSSFWGWVDAFAAKVATSSHIWSLPGKFEDAHVKLLFQRLFSPTVFEELARKNPALTMTAMDLVTTNDLMKVHARAQTRHLDHSNHSHKAIVLVDDNGHYICDWRASDAENARQIVILFHSIVRWFENSIHTHLIGSFAASPLYLQEVESAMQKIFDTEIKNCTPVQEFSDKQRKHLNDYLKKIIKLPKGLHATFKDLGDALDLLVESEFKTFKATLDLAKDKELFNTQGELIENRPMIFKRLEKIFNRLEETIQAVNEYTDRLSVMAEVKEKVLGHPAQFVMLNSDVDELRSKLEDFTHLTVVVSEGDEKWFPVGVVHASELRRAVLGTVSMRDFSNEGETRMASYLEVISVIDHHKTNLKTTGAPLFLITDAQSTNTIIADKNCELNRRYGTMGIEEALINSEISKTTKESASLKALDRLNRLATIKMSYQYQDKYFVHPDREFAEYLCYLFAILDDTDLLSKVSKRDVDALAAILNRMKSIACKNEEYIISFEGIEQNADFAKNAAERILRNPDMYSIYKKIYEFKEKDVETNLKACLEGASSTVFADTKEQNGCCRVGQTKLFQSNFSVYEAHAEELRTIWLEKAKEVYAEKSQVDFHLHMISTITGADEVYSGSQLNWDHRDEIWLWVPPTSQAMGHLAYFLNAFSATAAVQSNKMSVRFLGDNWHELQQAFIQNFPAAERLSVKAPKQQGLPIAVLYFNPGSINSRKAMITPCLPRLVP